MAWSPRGWTPEFPGKPGEGPQVYCYTDKYSYAPGEKVQLHASSTIATFDVTIIRDGAHPETVFEERNIAGRYTETPRDCYQSGCGWPVLFSFRAEPQWGSGFYLVIVRTWDDKGELFEREHFFVIRPVCGERAPLVLVLTTTTMNAYSDWGGANLYRGLPVGRHDPRNDVAPPWVSTQRPIARGMLRLPPGHPREAHFDTPVPFWRVRYPAYEWAQFHGYSVHFNDAFWATYERPFVVWAEQAGYHLDVITQQDLDEDPDVLDGHRCVVLVGHDEYYTSKMRDTLDRFLDDGGNIARFAGNILTRMTLGDGGTTQARGAKADGSIPEDFADRPMNSTFGLNATGYLRYGVTSPRSPGGYLIYRPRHWALSGTDLYYGDVLGAVPVGIVSFEVDGLSNEDWQMRDGFPVPTRAFPDIRDLEIIGMIPCVLGEEDRWDGQAALGTGFSLDPTDDPTPRMACMATYQRGNGTGFNAGTCEWVQGLIKKDWQVEKVTHNVLSRLGGIASKSLDPNVGHLRPATGGPWSPP